MKATYRIDITNRLPNIQDALPSDLGSALYIEAEKVMTDSKTNYVPVVTGNLRRTGIIMPVTYLPNGVKVVAGFGSTAVDYAAVVHEAPPTYGQGKRKYLSEPLQQAIPNMANAMASTIRSRINSRNFGQGKKTTWTWSM